MSVRPDWQVPSRRTPLDLCEGGLRVKTVDKRVAVQVRGSVLAPPLPLLRTRPGSTPGDGWVVRGVGQGWTTTPQASYLELQRVWTQRLEESTDTGEDPFPCLETLLVPLPLRRTLGIESVCRRASQLQVHGGPGYVGPGGVLDTEVHGVPEGVSPRSTPYATEHPLYHGTPHAPPLPPQHRQVRSLCRLGPWEG